jgi:hypothetical protein
MLIGITIVANKEMTLLKRNEEKDQKVAAVIVFEWYFFFLYIFFMTPKMFIRKYMLVKSIPNFD